MNPILIVSGPSGVGKNTVLRALEIEEPSLRRVTTHTTRPPRQGESEGSDYYFVDETAFTEMAKAGEFLDARAIYGHRYGLSRIEITKTIADGLTPVLEIDVEGGLVVASVFANACTIFLRPPSLDALYERLSARATESSDEVTERLHRAQHEIQLGSSYSYQVVHEDSASTVALLRRILHSLKETPQ
jgi:guanylate kinase